MNDDDNDDTPHTHVVTDGERRAHFKTYPPGTLPIQDSIDASQDQRIRALESRVDSLDASRRFWRWIAGLGIPAILSAAFVMLLYSADKIQAYSERAGETAAELRSLGLQIQGLEREIDQLRNVLLKVSGVYIKPGTSVVRAP